MGGYTDISMVIKTATGASLGAILGAVVLSKLPPDYIRMGFGAVMVAAAVKLFIGQ